MTRCYLLVVCLVGVMCTLPKASCGEELDVLPETLDGVLPHEMMSAYLLKQVDDAWEQWKATYEEVKTPEQIAAYVQYRRGQFVAALGGWPERTPLNPQVTGVLERDGYRVEKVIYESLPQFYVTALLFLPDADAHTPPYPGVLVPCGHAQNGKAHDAYQSMGAFLALSGMAAIVFDPVDQGERAQWLDENGKPPIWGTKAHTMLGVGSMLVGRNTAWFEVWDGMRGIDYLQSRPEVDAERIGCTGNSGGGTQTSFLMALDDRIDVAAPSCYLNRLGRQVVTSMGDAEQNIYRQLAFGMDHADYIIMRAPKPTILLAATQDFFEIEATWESFRFAKRMYTRMGYSERVDLLENDEKHNYNKLQREAGARWLARWLLGNDEPLVEPDLTLLSDEEVRCTPEGEVLELEGARSAYDINREYERELATRRRELWASTERGELVRRVREIAGIRPVDDLPEPEIVEEGTIARDGHEIEKLVIKPEPGIRLPALRFVPGGKEGGSAVLFIHEGGKATDIPAIREMLTEGKVVLAVDVRGTGETRQASQTKFGESIGLDWIDFYRAYVLGRTYVGMRAEDVLVCARYLLGQGAEDIELVAVGNVGVPALHAAALEPGRFSAVTLSGVLVSWANAVECGQSHNQLINAVHGALEVYDLSDLARLLGVKLTVDAPLDAMGRLR